jgi:hypothetical protein
MKNNKSITRNIFILGLSFCFYTAKPNINPEKEVSAKTEKTIKASFNLSGLSVNEQKVEILFSTGENGSINFVLAKTSDTELKKEIEKQFSLIKLPMLQKEVVNSVVLSFKKI